jgi:Zn-dependent protease
VTANLIVLGVTWFVVFLFSTTLHEAGHALAAYRLGDPTAYHGGQVSLSPFPHIRRAPVGMVVIPIITFALSRGAWMMGWANAPYDPLWAHRHPRRAAVMALAGPAANLILVLLSGLAIRAGLASGAYTAPTQLSLTAVTVATGPGLAASAATPLSILFSLNLILFVFNLLPLPPLDGSTAIALLMTDDMARRYQQFIYQPMFSMLGLVVAWQVFNPIIWPVIIQALRILYR